MPETGYGSELFLRACRAEAAWREVEGRGPGPAWRRRRAGSAELARYLRRLPSIEIRPSGSPTGRMIGEHFAIRDDSGRLRYRDAQGVLPLPADFATYMRGRSRQAVRTNVGHARRAGVTTMSFAVDGWAPGEDDSRAAHITPGPIERWMALAPDGVTPVADSILSVDGDVALLHGMVAFSPHARWLLHTAIVERLCGSCKVLLTNSDDAYKLDPGTQHFQQLLGYQVMRLRLGRPQPPLPIEESPQPAGLWWPPGELSCGIALEPAPAPVPALQV
jgi:hypothetical protein